MSLLISSVLRHGHRLCTRAPFLLRTRLYNEFGSPDKYKRIQTILQDKDKLPNYFELIYRGKIEAYLTAGTIAMLITTTATGSLVLYKLFSERPFMEPLAMGREENIIMAGSGLEMSIGFGLFLLMTVAAIYLTRRTVLRIYNHKDEYVAVFVNMIKPWETVKVHFRQDEVVCKPKKTKGFVSHEDVYVLGDRKAAIIDTNFRTPFDLKKLRSMGDDDMF